MTFRDVLSSAWHNVGRRRARTVLAAVGVTIGIVVLVTMLSLGIGIRREMLKQFEQVGLDWATVLPGGRQGSGVAAVKPPAHPLTAAQVAEWEKRPDVVQVRTHISLPGSDYTWMRYGQTALPVSLPDSGINAAGPFSRQVGFIAGEELPPGCRGQIVLGQDIVSRLGVQPPTALLGQAVTIELHAPRGESTSFSFTVTGITDAPYWDIRMCPQDREKLKEWWFNQTDLLQSYGYDSVDLRTHSMEEATALADELGAQGFDVRTTQAQFDMVRRGMLIMEAMLSSIGLLALLIAGIGIANTMVMAIYERTPEIGLLKALGASRGQIRALFLVEAALIGLFGALAGLAIGWLLGVALNRLALVFFQWQNVPVSGTFFVTSPGLVLLALCFGTLVGTVAGLIPAARAGRMDPVRALRAE